MGYSKSYRKKHITKVYTLTGSHARSVDVIPRYCYASTWQIMPRPAGETERYIYKEPS